MTIKFYCTAACFVVLASPSAFAAKADYCAAYARDFADAQTQDKTLWQHKYDIALQSCLSDPKPVVQATPAPTPSKKIEKPKAAAVAKPAPAQPVADTPVEPKSAEVNPAATKPAVSPLQETDSPTGPAKLEPGSDAWNAYCANKYTSFDPTKGTYLSHTGVERKCLVTKS